MKKMLQYQTIHKKYLLIIIICTIQFAVSLLLSIKNLIPSFSFLLSALLIFIVLYIFYIKNDKFRHETDLSFRQLESRRLFRINLFTLSVVYFGLAVLLSLYRYMVATDYKREIPYLTLILGIGYSLTLFIQYYKGIEFMLKKL
jgi:hypothetical protein